MLTLRLVSTFSQYVALTNLFQEVTSAMDRMNILLNSKTYERLNHANSEHLLKQAAQLLPFEILQIHVPKNFLRKVVGYKEKNLYWYKKNHTVDFDFNRELLVDEVFSMNETTPVRLFGRNMDVVLVNEQIQKELGQLQMRTLLFQSCDCKIIMDNVKDIKTRVDPCELRVRRNVREWKDMRHPFYYVPNYLREVVLIGTKEEITKGERSLEDYLAKNRPIDYKKGTQQLSYLLPISFKNYMPELKRDIIHRFRDL
mmetsp:Transcript_29453/g.21906  ORF Transcript_29453/g.21906 Transcript_29453/m.21906 type:complete len:256 (-) Transcript_29453:806-1573(-)